MSNACVIRKTLSASSGASGVEVVVVVVFMDNLELEIKAERIRVIEVEHSIKLNLSVNDKLRHDIKELEQVLV